LDPLVRQAKDDKSAATTERASIRGEKILAQARKIIEKNVTKGSGPHNIKRVDLETNAYAVIAKPLRWLAAPKS